MGRLMRVVKATAEVALTTAGIAAVSRRRRAGRTLVLAYHNIVPHLERVAGDSSLHLPQAKFADQLDILVRTHDVVPLSCVLSGDCVRSKRPRAVITFDDATQGALTAGVAELVARGLPATIFVAPAFVGGMSFWWDSLTVPGGGAPGEDLRQHALWQLGGSDVRVREWAASHSFPLRKVPHHQTCGTELQLQAAAAQGIEFGAHTWSHPNLTTLEGRELELELARPLAWLSERFPTTLPWLAYPYGLWNAAVASAARAAGYHGALRVDGGWVPDDVRAAGAHALPRQNIPAGLSQRGFALRVSGVTGG